MYEKTTEGRGFFASKQWGGDIDQILVDPGVPSSLYVAYETGRRIALSRSPDEGVMWQDAKLVGLAQYLGRLQCDPRSPDIWYVLAYSEQAPHESIFRSTDGGSTWENISGPLSDAGVVDILVDPSPGGTLYVLTEKGLFGGFEGGGGGSTTAPGTPVATGWSGAFDEAAAAAGP